MVARPELWKYTKGRYTGSVLKEDEFVYRGNDHRWYFTPESIIHFGKLMADAAIEAWMPRIIDTGGLPDLLGFPGRGAYPWGEVFLYNLTQFANKYKLKVPKFIPYVAGLYGAGEKAGDKVQIFGIQEYIDNGTIHSGMWFENIDDVIESSKSFIGLDNLFKEQGINITLGCVAAVAKIPICWQLRKGLEERVVTPRYHVYNSENPTESWFVFPSEVSDAPAWDSLTVIDNKGIKMQYGGITLRDVMFNERIEGMAKILRAAKEKTPTVRLLASFLMYRMYKLQFGIPEIVAAEYPDKDFDKRPAQGLAPAVPFCDAARGEPRFKEAFDVLEGRQANYIGRNSNKPTPKANVPFNVWTKGTGNERKMQGVLLSEGQHLALIGNYVTSSAKEIQNATGAETHTASLFKTSTPADITFFNE